jgi:hypothetical protein
MRRIVARGGHGGVIALVLTVVGCGGGGVDEGMPKDTTPVVPLQTIKADMQTRNVPPVDAKKTDAKKAP